MSDILFPKGSSLVLQYMHHREVNSTGPGLRTMNRLPIFLNQARTDNRREGDHLQFDYRNLPEPRNPIHC